MKLQFLGSGSAFTLNNYQSNMLLTNGNDKLLIDCGSDIRFSLREAGYSYKDITEVYISHLHADHIGGLEYLGFTRRFDPSCQKPSLYMSRDIAGDLWARSLSGGMRSLQGEVADIDRFFELHRVGKNGTFDWSGTDFRIVQTVHIMDGFAIIPSYGLMFVADGLKVFISTDAQFCPAQIKDMYKMSDVIFHDCETSPYASGVHAHYNELKTLCPEIKNKMLLYHYQDGALPKEEEDGFLGFVRKGAIFDFLELGAYMEHLDIDGVRTQLRSVMNAIV